MKPKNPSRLQRNKCMTRKLVNQDGSVSIKDDTGAFIKASLPPIEKKKAVRDPKPSQISLGELMDKHLLLLYRETRALLMESGNGGRLSKDSATMMRENLKLIVELRKKEKELLDQLSDDEIKKLIEEKIND